MDKMVIEGGRRLKGRVKICGAKNSALPIMASTILNSSRNILHNIPQLKDVKTMLSLLNLLGAKTEFLNEETLIIDTSQITSYEAPYELVKTMRAGIIILGPLLGRIGRARVSLPGGCAIGPRPVNLHILGLQSLGYKVETVGGYIEAEGKGKGNTIYFDLPTVTGTENIIMAAVLAEGETVIENAAKEPEVIDLANALKAMGAEINGEGTDTIRIKGVRELKGIEYGIIPDRIEAGTYLVAGAITRGEVEVYNCIPEHLTAVLHKLEETGAEIVIKNEPEVKESPLEANYYGSIFIKGTEKIAPVSIITRPYPGFPTDMQAQFMALLTLADGTSTIEETIFDSRFMHAMELSRMGAKISIGKSSAIIQGVEKLSGAELMASDLRASAGLILAALAAEGVSTVHRIYHLDRGYVKMEEKLQALGAKINRIPE